MSGQDFLDGEMSYSALEDTVSWHYEQHPPAGWGPIVTFSGRVPQPVVQEGEQAIRRHAEAAVRERLSERQQERDQLAHINLPFSYTWEGIQLEGQVVSTLDGVLKVKLTQPPSDEVASTRFGFAAAIAGIHPTDCYGNLTADGWGSAQRLLVQLYQGRSTYDERAKVAELVNRLNQ
jgi:hypothetical protein